MAARKTSSGRLLLDTGEWEALKDQVAEEVLQEVTQTEVPGARPGDSADFIRAIANDVYTTKQRECVTTGPVAQLTVGLKTVETKVEAVASDVRGVQGELKTAREVKEVQDRAASRRLALIVGSFTAVGVLANLLSVFWAIVHRGH
jgi:hypothetical protein